MNDERLRRLLADAVSDVEPDERLDSIRASVRPDPKVVPMARSRFWTYAGGIVATAAVIGVVAFATGAVPGFDQADDVTPAGQPGPSQRPSTGPSSAAPSSATTSPSTSATGAAATRVAAVYYVGDGPQGAVLFREFTSRPEATKPLDAAVKGLMTDPADGDYRTSWAPGSLTGARLRDGVIEVTVGRAAPAARPTSLGPREASETVQQAIYTLQAAVQSRAKVQFLRNGGPAARVFGVDTSHPLAQGNVLTTLSLVNISDPAEGAVLARGPLVVDGVNNSFEGNVVVELRQGQDVVRKKAGIGGFGPDRLYPWRVTLDTTKLPPGDYTLVATTDDASGRGRVFSDSKVVHLR
jgi:hypothetical protein